MNGGFTPEGRKHLSVNGIDIAFGETGAGSPLYLLHGHPQTHLMWSAVAARLADRFTVIAPDLRGCGASAKPESDARHLPYSKRVMAADVVALADALGHERIFLAGHDRGARVAHRLALEHPDRVAALALLDIAPTRHMWRHVNCDFARAYWHWFFLTQPAPGPETIIAADPDAFWHANAARNPGAIDVFPPKALADYLTHYRDPATIHAICEEYRASATIDLVHDDTDFDEGRRIACPLLVLSGARSKVSGWYDMASVWAAYVTQLTVAQIDAGHFLAEEQPAATADALAEHFGSAASDEAS
ncbi:MAG: alpha/beta hydrolase [Pseudomonadota bacterium]